MTNAVRTARQLATGCPGNHRHIHLIRGRAKAAEVYPDELCKAIVRGLMEQMRQDGRIGAEGIGSIAPSESMKTIRQCYELIVKQELIIAYLKI